MGAEQGRAVLVLTSSCSSPDSTGALCSDPGRPAGGVCVNVTWGGGGWKEVQLPLLKSLIMMMASKDAQVGIPYAFYFGISQQPIR